MPELPEVETTLRGIAPHVTGARITEIIIRRHDLRQPISPDLPVLKGFTILTATRRSKYLLLKMEDASTLLIHLGMSGSLRLTAPADPWKTHDHFGVSLAGGLQLRYHDPRRFGLILRLTEADPLTHPLLCDLGPEPLEPAFTAEHLAAACAGRSIAIKPHIMNAKIVVGVGNIYASEALFRAGIRPTTAARRISRARLEKLTTAIRTVLSEAIAVGGTTLRDFLQATGQPGYFAQSLAVYGRAGQPCRICATPIRQVALNKRATYWCPKCQK